MGLVQLSPLGTQVWKTCVAQKDGPPHTPGSEPRTKPRSTGAIGLGAGLTEYTATWLRPMSAARKSANAHREGYVSTLRCGPSKKPGSRRTPGRKVGMYPARTSYALRKRSAGK